MPCYTDPPSPESTEICNAAICLVFLLNRLNRPVPSCVRRASRDDYTTSPTVVPMLCATLKSLTASQMKKIVFDPHNRKSRDLANWWDDHQKMDRRHKREEREQRRRERLRTTAISKLTKKEREELGV